MKLNRLPIFLLALVLYSFGSFSTLGATELKMPPEINEQDKQAFSSWLLDYEKRKTDEVIVRAKGRYLNRLISSSSPYLKQHAKNPINWQEWSQDLLENSKKANQLIFLSIGYSTCHWCHVMEKESFVDTEVASVINKNYVAIKVDREELLHVDNYFAAALEQVKGSAGWPITAIINGDGIPVFIDSYVAKDKLLKILKRVHGIWNESPEFLLAAAQNIDTLVKSKYQSFELEEFEPKILESINEKLIAQLDDIDGGFTGNVKFPSESMLMYAIDQLRRAPNARLEELLILQLDKMIAGGIYDHIFGGFHRYSTDPTWTVPHFEKMLYNQAQLIIVYSQAYQLFGKESYKRVVIETTDFVLREFYSENGFYSASDADFNGEEGGFYLWDKNQINLLGKGIDYLTYNVAGSDKVGVTLNHNQSFDQSIEQFRERLTDLRKQEGRLHIDKKILTGWNGLMLSALGNAFEVSKQRKYLDIAEKVAATLWEDRYREGMLFRQSKTQDVFYLEDYAYFASALVALFDYTDNREWLVKSEAIASSFSEFISPENNSGTYQTQLQISDTELFSPHATAFNVINKLESRRKPKAGTAGSDTFSKLMTSKIKDAPLNNLFAASALKSKFEGDKSSIRYFAQGNGKFRIHCIKFIQSNCSQLELKFSMEPGWHINSNSPHHDYLIPTTIKTGNGIQVDYPKAKLVKLGFEKQPLSLFEDEFSISLNRIDINRSRELVELPLQACNDRVCLLPERTFLLF